MKDFSQVEQMQANNADFVKKLRILLIRNVVLTSYVLIVLIKNKKVKNVHYAWLMHHKIFLKRDWLPHFKNWFLLPPTQDFSLLKVLIKKT